MSGKSRWDYLKAIYVRYQKVSKPLRAQILDEFCQVCDYNRKYAIRLLNGPAPHKPKATPRQGRPATYGAKVISSLTAIWEAAGYPCSVRLKALLALWLPWAIKRMALSAQVQKQLLTISPATIDRRLKGKKHQLKKRLYGRTKPGTLLKHHIPIKTDSWDIKTPGFTEIDLVWTAPLQLERIHRELRGRDRRFWLVEMPTHIPQELNTPEPNAIVFCRTPPQ